MIFLQRVDYRIIPVSLYYQYLGRRKVTCIVLLVTLCWSIQVLGFHQSWSQSIPMTSEESSDPRMDANHALFVQSQRGILVFWGNIYTSGSPFYMPGEKECENCQKKKISYAKGDPPQDVCVFSCTQMFYSAQLFSSRPNRAYVTLFHISYPSISAPVLDVGIFVR